MTNPTRQEIIEAHDALNRIYQHLLYDKNADLRALNTAIEAIHRILPPKPRPTMAEVEWDDDKHYLAEAEHADWGTMTMLKPMRTYPQIKCLSTKGGDYCIVYPSTEDLTPTGKRYTLTEVQE